MFIVYASGISLACGLLFLGVWFGMVGGPWMAMDGHGWPYWAMAAMALVCLGGAARSARSGEHCVHH